MQKVLMITSFKFLYIINKMNEAKGSLVGKEDCWVLG